MIEEKLIPLVAINVICFSSYTLPLFLMPLLAHERNISQTTIGLIFSFFSVGEAIVSIICGKMMFIWGKKLLLKLGFYTLALSLFFFGLMFFIENKALFIIIGNNIN
jgi:MFS family permease